MACGMSNGRAADEVKEASPGAGGRRAKRGVFDWNGRLGFGIAGSQEAMAEEGRSNPDLLLQISKGSGRARCEGGRELGGEVVGNGIRG